MKKSLFLAFLGAFSILSVQAAPDGDMDWKKLRDDIQAGFDSMLDAIQESHKDDKDQGAVKKAIQGLKDWKEENSTAWKKFREKMKAEHDKFRESQGKKFDDLMAKFKVLTQDDKEKITKWREGVKSKYKERRANKMGEDKSSKDSSSDKSAKKDDDAKASSDDKSGKKDSSEESGDT